MQYLKSGFSPLEPDACDRLERYAYFWNIRGSQWLKPWTRHPEGFGQTFDEETDRQLLTLNVWREGAMEPLQTLHEVWLSGRTVSERLHALRAFLEQTHFPEIACEQTNRVNCTMEFDPKYVDVIRRRWAEFVHGEGCDWQALTPAVEE